MATTPPLPEQLLLENLPFIDRAAARLCRFSHLSPQETEDFTSCVHIKLIEDDYRVFRLFKGQSSLQTYLVTVIRLFLKDYQNHLWGKFRASAEAERLGEVAIQLEQLLYRDGCSAPEAYQILRVNRRIEMSEEELEELRAKLPIRLGRHMVGEDRLKSEAARGLRPDQEFLEKERNVERRRLRMALHKSLESLSTDDRLLLNLWAEFSVADIARLQKVDQKPLYARLKKLHKKLKLLLEDEGVRRKDVLDLLNSLESDLYAKPKEKE